MGENGTPQEDKRERVRNYHIKDATAQISKLSLQEGDILVFRHFPPHISPQALMARIERLGILPKDVSMVILPDEIEVEHLPEEVLNEQGYYRIEEIGEEEE